MVSPLYECAGGSSVSAGDGNVFHRCDMGKVSPQCGSEHGHAGEPPTQHTYTHNAISHLGKYCIVYCKLRIISMDLCISTLSYNLYVHSWK